MRQKIDIADVETATKIRAKFLRALENEEFGLLPGNTFVKTFLRTYAEPLGLDPQLLLEEYRAEYEPRAEGEMQPYAVAARQRPRQRRPRAPSGPPGAGTALIVIVGVVLVIFAILGLTSGGNDNGSSPSSTTAQKPKKNAESGKQKAASAPTRVKLRIVPASATYVCIDRGPGTPVVDQRTLTSPARYRGKRLRVNLGNSSATVSANGKRVKIPPGPSAVGYDFRLRSGKVKWAPIPLGQRPCA